MAKQTHPKSEPPETHEEKLLSPITGEKIELEIELEKYTNGDFEVLEDFMSGNKDGHKTKEIFDILDRIIVGGFRSRPMVELLATVGTVINNSISIATGKSSKN